MDGQRRDPRVGSAGPLTCSTCSLLSGAEEIWYLLESLRPPLLHSQRTSGLGSPQTTARKMAFFPVAGREAAGPGQGSGRGQCTLLSCELLSPPLPRQHDRPPPAQGLLWCQGDGSSLQAPEAVPTGFCVVVAGVSREG